MPKTGIQRGDKLEVGVYSLPTPERVDRQQIIDKLRTAFRLDETDENEEQIEDENTYD